VIGRVPEDGEELFHAWEQAIDALERDVLRAERFAADPAGALAQGAELPSGWLPTGLDGTIPATLAERARGLLRRQADAREQLAGALERTRLDLTRVRRPAPVVRAAGPAYLDISA
jgi:hypothetical protein